MPIIQNRRTFLASLSAASGVGLFGTSTPAWAESPPETTSVRLPRWIGGAYCWAGLYLAGELLRAEGFTDVNYVQGDPTLDQSAWIARGETDFSVNYAPVHVRSIDAGVPIKVLGGLHVGCLELIANDSIQRMADLRGKRVGVYDTEGAGYVLVSLMAGYVGLDPANDIEWVIVPSDKAMADSFVAGKSMHSSASRPSCRSCAPRKSAIRFSIRPSTRRGRTNSAA